MNKLPVTRTTNDLAASIPSRCAPDPGVTVDTAATPGEPPVRHAQVGPPPNPGGGLPPRLTAIRAVFNRNHLRHGALLPGQTATRSLSPVTSRHGIQHTIHALNI